MYLVLRRGEKGKSTQPISLPFANIRVAPFQWQQPWPLSLPRLSFIDLTGERWSLRSWCTMLDVDNRNCEGFACVYWYGLFPSCKYLRHRRAIGYTAVCRESAGQAFWASRESPYINHTHIRPKKLTVQVESFLHLRNMSATRSLHSFNQSREEWWQGETCGEICHVVELCLRYGARQWLPLCCASPPYTYGHTVW